MGDHLQNPKVVNLRKRGAIRLLTESTNLLAFFGLSNCEREMGRRRRRRRGSRRSVEVQSKDMLVVR